MDIGLMLLLLKSVFKPDLNKKIRAVTSESILPEYEAILTGDGAIAQGESTVAIGAGSVLISGDVESTTIVTGDNNIVAGRDAVMRDKKIEADRYPHGKEGHVSNNDLRKIIDRAAFVRSQLEISYKQTREQSYMWFRSSLIAAGVGFLLVIAGVIAIVFGQVTEGMLSTISSIVPNTIAALFFLQLRASNERVDAILRKLNEAREIETAVEIANSVETKRERDRLKSEIVRKVIGLSSGQADGLS